MTCAIMMAAEGVEAMDTIKINKRNTRMVAHAGLAGLEMANTNAGFIAAGNRSYFGIETDVRVTKDKQIVVVHDGDLKSISGQDISVEDSTLEELQKIMLYDRPFFYGMEEYGYTVQEGVFRSDLRTPSLGEYIRICKKYGKTAVLELKSPMNAEEIAIVVEQIRQQEYLDQVIFISFYWDNLVEIRKLLPDQTVQYLTGMETEFTDSFIQKVAENHFDLDIHVFTTTKEVIDRLHAAGIKVNCWTVDWPDRAEMIAEWGADYITSNILE